jgi:hypothetical protein
MWVAVKRMSVWVGSMAQVVVGTQHLLMRNEWLEFGGGAA